MTSGKPAAADTAWQTVLDASEPLDPPAQWAKKEPTQKEVPRFHLRASKSAAKGAAKARQFYSRFPDHPKAFRARVKECELLAVAAHLGDTRQKEQFESAQKALWNDLKLTDDDRFNIRSAGVQRIAYYLQFKGYFSNLDDFEKSVRELRREFPKRDEPYELLLVLAKNRFWDDQMDKARAGAEELAASSAPASIVEEARSMLKRFARVGQPIAFKFTALAQQCVSAASSAYISTICIGNPCKHLLRSQRGDPSRCLNFSCLLREHHRLADRKRSSMSKLCKFGVAAGRTYRHGR